MEAVPAQYAHQSIQQALLQVNARPFTRQVLLSAYVQLYKHVGYLWLREHVEVPRTHLAIGGDGDEVVGILCPHNIQTVHRLRVSTARQGKTHITLSQVLGHAYMYVTSSTYVQFYIHALAV